MTPKSPPPNLSLTAAVVVNRNSGNYGISREVIGGEGRRCLCVVIMMGVIVTDG